MGRDKSMRLLRLPKADIDSGLRETFEQYGEVTMQVALGAANYIHHKGQAVSVGEIRGPLLKWLTEQYDKADRRESWLLVMEVAITVLVLGELAISIIGLLRGNSK